MNFYLSYLLPYITLVIDIRRFTTRNLGICGRKDKPICPSHSTYLEMGGMAILKILCTSRIYGGITTSYLGCQLAASTVSYKPPLPARVVGLS